MKLWEILPNLKKEERIRSKTTGNIYELSINMIYPVIEGVRQNTPCRLSTEFFKQEYEIVHQFVPFEEALKAFKDGMEIKYHNPNDVDLTLKYHIGERLCDNITFQMIIEGKWSICNF